MRSVCEKIEELMPNSENCCGIGIAMEGMRAADGGWLYPMKQGCISVCPEVFLAERFRLPIAVKHDPECVLYSVARHQEDCIVVRVDKWIGVAAMKNGSVDAALVAANFLINCQNEGDTVLATAKGYAVPKLMMTASERFIKEHPERLAAVLAAHEEATVWMEQNHDEALAIGAKEQGISLADAQKLFDWTVFVRKFDDNDLKTMEDDMQFLIDNGMMRNRVDIPSLFLTSALK